MTYSFIPRGVCSEKYTFDLVDGKIYNLKVYGGCNGNLQGICKLVEGKDAKEIVKCLNGIKCGRKNTSCPDQISIAISRALVENEANQANSSDNK